MIVVRIETKQNFLTNGTQVFSLWHVSALHMFHYISSSTCVITLTAQPFASTKWTYLGLNFRICTTGNNLLNLLTMKLCDMIFKSPTIFKDLVTLGTGVIGGLHVFCLNMTFDIELLRIIAALHTLPLASPKTKHHRLNVCKENIFVIKKIFIVNFCETLPCDVLRRSYS